ncbi:MAG: NepR family anti-sigma factor [Micropepsaceae bacterium]
MNEIGVKSRTSTGDTPPARSTRERRRYGRLLAETQLTTLFNNIAEQPIPDEFLDLLRRIDARCAPT